MSYSESYFFICALSLGLAIPFSIAVRTLLGMKHRMIVPILRVPAPQGG